VLFVASGGTPVFKHLEEGETITVDSRSVTMIENTVSLGITPNGKICMCCFGGEGCCSTTLTGPGKIFMQVRMEVDCTVGDVSCDTYTASCGPCTHAHTLFRNKLLLFYFYFFNYRVCLLQSSNRLCECNQRSLKIAVRPVTSSEQ
jgi:hypothetical protein